MVRYGAVAVVLLSASLVAVSLLVGQTPAAQAAPPQQEFVLKESISQYWDEGYRITDVAYGDGQWAVVMTEIPGDGHQAWTSELEFPADFIQEKWDEGLDLTTLTYGDGMWVAVMTGGLDWGQAVKHGTFSEFKDYVDEHQDFMITEVAYGDGEWVAVMSQMDDGNAQYWRLSSAWPVDDITDKWNEGYSVTAVTSGPSEWLVVMTDDTGYTMDRVVRRVEWPEADLEKDYEEIPEGSVVSLDYGDGLWVYTYAVTDWDGRQTVLWQPALTPVEPAETTSQPSADERVEDIRTSIPDATYDFESDSGGWELNYDADFATFLRGGAYRVTVDSEDTTAWGYGIDEASDFYAEVDVRHMGGTSDTEAGIAFRCTELDNCYFFFLHPGATYSLQSYIDGEWRYLVDQTESDAIETGEGSTNRLALLARGDEISLYVNDIPLADAVDDSISGVEIGLAASAFDGAGVEFAFDNFSLWNLDEEAKSTVAPSPTPVATDTPPTSTVLTQTLAPTPVPTAISTPALLPNATAETTADSGDDLDLDLSGFEDLYVDAIKTTAPSYEYDFSGGERWEIPSAKESERYYADDALHIRVIPEQRTEWSRLEPELTDYYLEFDLAFLEEPQDAGAGLVFDMADSSNFYRYAISPHNTFSLLKRVDGEWEFLTEWTSSDSLNAPGSVVNRLGILKEGHSIAVFANGDLLAVAEDASLGPGDVAFAVIAYDEGNIEVEFDNLVIWDLTSDLQVDAKAPVPAQTLPLPAKVKKGVGSGSTGD